MIASKAGWTSLRSAHYCGVNVRFQYKADISNPEHDAFWMTTSYYNLFKSHLT